MSRTRKNDRENPTGTAANPDDGVGSGPDPSMGAATASSVKFVIYGEEMLEKEVKLSGKSGRVYLPPDWVGHQVKVIRIG